MISSFSFTRSKISSRSPLLSPEGGDGQYFARRAAADGGIILEGGGGFQQLRVSAGEPSYPGPRQGASNS
jgi:hypothetical protein